MKFINSLKNENSRDASRSVFLRGKIFLVCSVFFFGVMLTACSLSGEGEKPVMVSFQFEASKNGDLTADLTGSISGSLITVEIPVGELTTFKSAFDDLTPSFTAQGSVSVNGAEQVSGRDSLDFRGPVFYEITNSAGEKRIYEVEFKSGDLVYLPDGLFRAYLKSLTELSSAFDGDWLDTDDSGLASVETIDPVETIAPKEGQPIRSVQGVQYFPNLEILKITPTGWARGNQFKGIDLTELTKSELNGDPKLTHVDLSNNKKLVILDLSSTFSLSSVDLSQNTALEEVILQNTLLKSVDLSQNTELTKLELSGHPKLTHVDLSNNKKLVILDLSYNRRLSSVDLSQNTALEEVILQNTLLKSVDLSQNTELTKLELSGHPKLTHVDLSNNKKLVILDLSFNESLSSVDLSQNTELTKLELSGHPKLNHVDLSNNKKLTKLQLSRHPKLTHVDLSNNKKLTKLELSGNPPLTHVDLSNNKKLVILDLSFNRRLSSVDLSQNTALEEVILHNTLLKNVDFGGNTVLKKLVLYNTSKLESLDLSQNTRLEDLRMGINSVSSTGLLKNLDIRGFRDDSETLLILYLDPDQFPDLKKLKVHENLKDHAQVKALKTVRGDALTIEVYSAADGSTEYTLVDGDYTPS